MEETKYQLALFVQYRPDVPPEVGMLTTTKLEIKHGSRNPLRLMLKARVLDRRDTFGFPDDNCWMGIIDERDLFRWTPRSTLAPGVIKAVWNLHTMELFVHPEDHMPPFCTLAHLV
jgi:hypothetical protein